MKTRKLGKSNLHVSELILGTVQFGWSADEETSWAIMDAFVEAGGTTIDTADIYTTWAEGTYGGISEEIIGHWMRKRNNRQNLIIATKGRGRMWPGEDGEGLSRAHLTRAIDDSLRRLQTDYIDLYQTHWDDETTPMEETMRVLNDFVQSGKVRAIGCSNFSAARLQESLYVSEHLDLARYNCLQPHYNLVHRSEYEHALRQVCTEHTIGVIPYSPLAGGFLTGKYRRDAPIPESTRSSSVQQRYCNERGWQIIDALDSVANKLEQPIAQIALAWLMSQPTVTAPILGANNLNQLQDQLNALTITLDTESMALLTSISSGM